MSVVVHGSNQSAAGFWRLTAALARRGHRVVTVEVTSATAETSTGYAELLAARLPADCIGLCSRRIRQPGCCCPH